MRKKFDVPSISNYWEQSILTITSASTEAPKVVEQVQAFVDSGLLPVSAPPEGQKTTHNNSKSKDPLTMRQEADLFWRRAVKAVAVTTAGKKGKTANQVRQACLQHDLGSRDDHDGDEDDEDERLELFLAGNWLTEQEEGLVRVYMKEAK